MASHFASSVQALVQALTATTPHFIRCIKPNADKSPDRFNGAMVLHQLQYSGMIQVIEARQAGYPVRISHEEFVDTFMVLVPLTDWRRRRRTGRPVVIPEVFTKKPVAVSARPTQAQQSQSLLATGLAASMASIVTRADMNHGGNAGILANGPDLGLSEAGGGGGYEGFLD